MNAGSVPGPDPQYTQIVRNRAHRPDVPLALVCVKASKTLYGATENTARAIEFPRFFPCIAGIAGKVDHERAMDSAMTRAGVTYVAMAAAGISAAVLGYGVIWSYGEPEAPPVAMSAPPAPEQQNPIPPIASAPSDATAQLRRRPNPVAAASTPPLSAPPTATQPPAETSAGPVTPPLLAPQPEPAREATSPASLPRTADVTAPERKIEKPQAATAPMDTQTAASVTRTVAPPKTKSSAALTSADRPQAASRPLKPPAQEAAKTEIAEPSPRPAEKPVVAQPLLEPAVAAPRESAAAASQPQQVTRIHRISSGSYSDAEGSGCATVPAAGHVAS